MRVRAWQFGFLGGLVVCLGAAVAAFGPAWTLGVTGVVALAIRLITALTGPKDSLTAALQRLLNIKRFLRLATIAVWAASIGLGVFAIRQTYRQLNPPPPPPPFRVSYFLLEHYAADLLLQGKIDQKWEAKLAGQTYIVPNSVFQKLSYLERTFSDKLPKLANGLWVSKPGKKAEQDKLSDSNRQVESFKTGMAQGDNVFAGNLLNPVREIDLRELPKYIRLLKNPAQPWKLLKVGYEGGDDSFIFRTYAGRSDLELLEESRYKQFHLHLATERMPPDFGYVDLYTDDTGTCGGDDDSEVFTVIQFVGRTPKLRVAVLENITDQPIKLGKFTFKETQLNYLRSREEDQALLGNQSSQDRSLFAPEILKPGERIVIPIELLMGFRDTEDLGEAYATAVDLKEDSSLLNQYKGSGPVYFPGATKGARFSIDSATLDGILARQQAKFPLNEDYVYGPSLRIESIEIDSVRYPFREYDASRIVITEGLAMGSCPYIYTYASDSQTWEKEGVILYALNEKRKERLDELQLHRFTGQLLIKEEDDEESFIDSVYVKAISSDGTETILHPTNNVLASTDKRYVRLKKGDQLLVDFDLSRGVIATRYVLGAVGYYLPDEPGQERAPRTVRAIR